MSCGRGKVESDDEKVARIGRTKTAAWKAWGGGIVGYDGEGRGSDDGCQSDEWHLGPVRGQVW